MELVQGADLNELVSIIAQLQDIRRTIQLREDRKVFNETLDEITDSLCSYHNYSIAVAIRKTILFRPCGT